jgi:hypothetical protein
MTLGEVIMAARRSSSTPATATERPAEDPELVAQRARLTERFALMQSELGGLFYEMAIRDHVRMEVLIEKAAALQRVDTELAQVEHSCCWPACPAARRL